MERAVRFCMDKIEIELVEEPRFSCCPDPIYFKAGDRIKWMTLAARNLALAEERGLDIITMCSGCTSTLCEVNHHLIKDTELRQEINKNMQPIGRSYDGKITVRHLVTLLRDEIGLEKIHDSVERPLTGLSVAIHYGCHLLKPSSVMAVEDPLVPSILARLIEMTGATPVDHEEYLKCCGKACKEPELTLKMSQSVFESVDHSTADCLGLICPTCFDSFDVGQLRVSRTYGKEYKIPIIYYFQLLAIAQGAKPEQVGIQYHKILSDSFQEKISPKTMAVN